MKPAVSKKYCKTDIWLSCRHTEGSALSSATSSSRQGSALQSIWIWVLICWQLDLQVLREGLWGKSCCCWMGSGWGDKAEERERIHPCNVCDKAFKSLQIASQYKIWQHTGNVFACRCCGKKFNPNKSKASTDTISLCVASLNTGRVWPLLHVGQGPPLRRSSSIWTCGVRRRGRGRFWPAPGRGRLSSTLSNGNLLCWFLISSFV